MPLPQNFSPAEHLQDLLKVTINREVRDWFGDVGSDDWDPDLSTARGSLRVGCTHLEGDSMDMSLMRLMLFYMVCRKGADLQGAVYGIPIGTFQSQRKYRPQITLYFLEDPQDVDENFPPVTGEISFRLMAEDENSLTMAEANSYANRVRTAFGSGNGFVWRKGKTMASYTDWNRGYQLQLLVRDEAEAKRVIEQVLDVQQHTPDWKFLNIGKNEEPSQAFPTLPPNQVILGKSRRLPRKRPIADVRFQYASLDVWGIPTPIILVDRSGRFSNPLAS